MSHIEGALVAQRLKRLPTIVDKLRRYPDMSLSRMHDIGGLRAVVNDVEQVRELQEQYKDAKRFSHELVRFDDYITTPKPDGYRSIHLVYKYNNTLARNKIAQEYSGLRIELQVRTYLQHVWATAVETMGTLRGEALKSQMGDKEWLEFFIVSSAAFAHLEKTPAPDKYKALTLGATVGNLAKLDKKLKAVEKMMGLSAAARLIHSKDISGYYKLIILNTKEHSVQIRAYGQEDLIKASKAYEAIEKRVTQGEPLDAVLVSAGKLSTLKQAYPNYFLDIRTFASYIQAMIEENSRLNV